MRRLLTILLTLTIMLALYVGTAVLSLKALIADLRRGDTAAIMSHVDLPRLRDSLAQQIVRTYFTRIEQTRPVKNVERVAAPTVVDALLAQWLTPENVTRMLQSGTLPALGHSTTPVIAIPPLSGAGLESTLRILARLRPKSPVQLQVLLDDGAEAAIRLHFEGTHWKLSGIDLPAPVLHTLILTMIPR